jgi:CDP-diacylglycerol--glycerol-3-phosphate 3-phosphatidyltransferase/cardiolipin synthase
VTSARIALIPVFVLVAEAARDSVSAGLPAARLQALTFALVLAIASSDKLDGYLARRSARGPTRRGAILDALADRLMQWTGAFFFAFRAEPAFTPIPLWLPLALAARDLFVLIVWVSRRGGTTDYEHEVHGKVATALVFGLLLASAAGLTDRILVPASVLAVSAALYSTSRYAVRIRRARQLGRAPKGP